MVVSPDIQYLIMYKSCLAVGVRLAVPAPVSVRIHEGTASHTPTSITRSSFRQFQEQRRVARGILQHYFAAALMRADFQILFLWPHHPSPSDLQALPIHPNVHTRNPAI